MDDFKEFQGRCLDECIEQAIRWFDSPREELEIDILQDAKSGIFGIVGARKARIRARRAHVAESVRDILGKAAEAKAGSGDAGGVVPGARAAKRQGAPAQGRQRAAPREEDGENEAGADPAARMRGDRGGIPKRVDAAPEFDEDDQDDAPTAPADLDPELFERSAREIVSKLVTPIAGREISMQVDLAAGRPRIKIDWEGDAGLIIGRDGQTLAALQYMGSRLLSRALGAPVRIQLDIGEYRKRQDEKLRELAYVLAEKVRQTGKPASTRPLSSYHRRVVHLCLQNEPDILTRSTGEGVMKRVVILPGRS